MELWDGVLVILIVSLLEDGLLRDVGIGPAVHYLVLLA